MSSYESGKYLNNVSDMLISRQFALVERRPEKFHGPLMHLQFIPTIVYARMLHKYKASLASILVLTPFLHAANVCELSATAWPTPAWRDIMRGTAVQVCDQTKVGDGRCDNSNNMMTSNCEMDGGDCCITSCYQNCVTKQLTGSSGSGDVPYALPQGIASQCAFTCGVQEAPYTNCPLMCLADDYMDKGLSYTSWCSGTRGIRTSMSNCYSTTGDIVSMLIECIKDDASHGNSMTGSSRCGNQTGDCSLADVVSKIDGCHLHPESCTRGKCCSQAISRAWIDPSIKVLPSACEVYATCAADPDCFPSLAECARTNKACRGGCCMCSNTEWFGANCDQPLCWPKCKHGKCVAPNVCHCDEGFSGESCEIPTCDPPCVGGQGVCISPNVCDCFYGWEGNQCEAPKSTPPCINGKAIAPDVCLCDPGWGGRICDYPLCQSFPMPSADCGNGICESPWTCACDPGWKTDIPAGTDGISVPPLFWRGRDLSANIGSYVYGDTRYNQTNAESIFFDQYNAFKCDTPSDCHLVIDNKCKECTANACTVCESSYYISAGRCEKCQLKYPHCRQCDSDRCLGCDPLFVLINGDCVSDGIFEFSSSRYNVRDTDEFVELTVLRTIDSMAGSVISNLTLLIQPESESAVSRSATVLSDFEFTSSRVAFGGISIDGTKNQSRSALVLSYIVRIPIYDNLLVDGDEKFFRAKLILDPNTVTGSVHSIKDIGKPSLEQDQGPIASTDIYVWDTRIFDYTKCTVGDLASPNVANGTVLNVPITCSICEMSNNGSGLCSQWRTMTTSDPVVLFTATTTWKDDWSPSIVTQSSAGNYVAAIIPKKIGIRFSILVQAVFSGIIARHFLVTSSPTAGQAADITRVEKSVNRTWSLTQDAPALAIYSGYLRFGNCMQTVPDSLGVSVSEGAIITMQIDNVTNALSAQRRVSLEDSDQVWQAPIIGAVCDENIFCYNSTTWNLVDLIRVNISFKPSQLFLNRPAGLRLLTLSGSDWTVVPTDCLLGGVDIQGTPLRGLVTV